MCEGNDGCGVVDDGHGCSVGGGDDGVERQDIVGHEDGINTRHWE